MNLYYMSQALSNVEFQELALTGEKPGPFLMAAFPGYPLGSMVELAQAAIDIALLWQQKQGMLHQLLNPLEDNLLAFQQRTILAETLLWAHAYLRDGGPIVSSFTHWKDHHLDSSLRRDVERYRAVNAYTFEYAYRLMNNFRGGARFDLNVEGFITRLLREAGSKDPVVQYDVLNQHAGFTGSLNHWAHDPIFNSIIERMKP